MKLSNSMNKQHKYQRFETSFDRKAKKAEKLHLRQLREQDSINMQFGEDEDDYLDELDEEENKELE